MTAPPMEQLPIYFLPLYSSFGSPQMTIKGLIFPESKKNSPEGRNMEYGIIAQDGRTITVRNQIQKRDRTLISFLSR